MSDVLIVHDINKSCSYQDMIALSSHHILAAQWWLQDTLLFFNMVLLCLLNKLRYKSYLKIWETHF